MASQYQPRRTMKEAQQRNWLKAKIICLLANVQTDIVTEDEEEVLSLIVELRNGLLRDWDHNTQALGFKTKHFTCWCGKKTNTPYLIGSEFYCKKHYKEGLYESQQSREGSRNQTQ